MLMRYASLLSRTVHIEWNSGIILCMRPANGRRRYNVTPSLIGWVHTQNDPGNWSSQSHYRNTEMSSSHLLTLWHVTSIIGPARDSQIPQCICSLSHNAPFRTEMCTFLFWMVHCGIWNRCSVGFVNLVVSVLAGVIAPNGACSSAGTLFILKLVLLQLCPKMYYLWLRLLNQTTLHTRRNLTSYRITPRENVSALNNITKYVKTLSATLKSGGIHGDSQVI